MAVFFAENNIACPKCGNTWLHQRKLKTICEDPKHKNVFQARTMCVEFVCENCNVVVKKFERTEPPQEV